MGIVIKFSAQALAEYKSGFMDIAGSEIMEYNIIHNLDKLGHTVRLSRIDLTADYINENVKVSTIYNQLKRGNQIIRYANGRKNSSSLSGYEFEKKADTIYIGKRVKNGNGLLRIYDKKKEQIDNYGFRYKEAVECDSWVRCEAEFHNKYAHDLTEALRRIHTKQELGNLIATAIVDRYSFYHVKSGKPTKITKKLLEMIESKEFEFSSPSPRNNDLEKSFHYLIWFSGLISFLYKIKEIWGEGGLKQVYDIIDHEVHTFKVTKDVSLWLRKYADQYKQMDKSELPFFGQKK